MRITIIKYLKIEYVLLFLCATEFLGSFNYIILILILYLLIKGTLKTSTILSRSFIYIGLFSLFYFIFASDSISRTDTLVWICSYIIGASLVKDDKSSFEVLLILGIGTGLHGLLISLLNYYSFGELGVRVLPDIWTGNIRGATSQSCAFLIFSGLLISILISKEISRIAKSLSLGFFIGMFFNAISTASRTAILFPLLIVLLTFIFITEKRNLLRWVFMTITILSIIFIIYNNNFLNIRSFYQEQDLYERFVDKVDGGILQNSRLGSWNYFLDNFDKHPWGGLNKYNPIGYMHNIFLDTYAFAGIITTFFLLLIVMRNMLITLKIMRMTDRLERSNVFGVFLSFLLIFNTEPIIQASPWYFSFFLMYSGILERRLEILRLSYPEYVIA